MRLKKLSKILILDISISLYIFSQYFSMLRGLRQFNYFIQASGVANILIKIFI